MTAKFTTNGTAWWSVHESEENGVLLDCWIGPKKPEAGRHKFYAAKCASHGVARDVVRACPDGLHACPLAFRYEPNDAARTDHPVIAEVWQ